MYGKDGIERYWSNKNTVDPFEIAKSARTKVIIRCDKLGHTDYSISPNVFNKGVRCGVCKNKRVIKGINDVATTKPDLVKYFVYAEDAYKYTCSSNKKVMLKCPNCASKKEMAIEKLNNRGLSCTVCSDGISYAEKYIYNMLSDLKIDFITQLGNSQFCWCKNYRYDFYLIKHNTIIEAHGMQHYKQSGYGKNLKDEQENDNIKHNLAKENNISNYIILDCRESDMEFMRNSIMNSEMKNILNIGYDDLDWNEIDKKSQKSKLIEVCEYYRVIEARKSDISKNSILAHQLHTGI